MTEHAPTTTDDPAALRQELDAAQARIRDLERQVDETCSTTEELQRALACLKEEYLALKRLMFGPRRERLPEDPNQLHLFDAPVIAPAEAADAAEAEPASSRKRRKGHGRRTIPDHVPRQRVVHDVPADQQVCDCGRAKAKIGEDVTEQLDYEPGKLSVLQHVYPKYACSCCKNGVTAAERPPSPIEGGLAGPGLLAHVIVSKFAVHIPLYRQQDELARAGVFLARSTLCGWIAQCALRLHPLVQLMRKRILKSHVIHADETPVPVLDPTRDSTRNGYLWTYVGDDDFPFTLFDYRDSRSRDGPTEILKDYRGYLLTDAYTCYDSVVTASQGRIIPVGCWAHARRGFFDARTNQPREAHYVLSLIGQLYEIEDQARALSAEQRLAARRDHGAPVLDRLKLFLDEQAPGALPKSQYGQAIGYVLNQWESLRRYLEDGRLAIDNNISERTLRVCAIGRKNWMFFGSDRGGETAATCLSILASAKRHLIEPFAYVRDLLTVLSKDDVDLEPLLPHNWIKAHPEHVLLYRREEAEAAANARRTRRRLRRAKHAEPGASSVSQADDGRTNSGSNASS
jgi:transposase